jgi:hypothetical protein
MCCVAGIPRPVILVQLQPNMLERTLLQRQKKHPVVKSSPAEPFTQSCCSKHLGIQDVLDTAADGKSARQPADAMLLP